MSSSELLNQVLAHGRIPHHLAIIMDGNGRWAAERGLPRHLGHKAGMKSVREVIEGAVDVGVKNLTLFAFSTQNWQRPRKEILALMTLLRVFADREAADLQEKGVEVHVLGDLDALDPVTRSAVDGIVEGTVGGTTLRLNLMVSYSARDEILRAVRRLSQRVAAGEIEVDAIDEDLFSSELFTCGVPDPDLLIRTSGEFRISNFLLWQLAYTEFHITPVLWPDFSRTELFRAVAEFQQRDRRFGRVSVTS